MDSKMHSTASHWKKKSQKDLDQQCKIVVSGIACRYPESDSVEEFWYNLVNHVDMVTEDNRRWTPGLFGLPRRNGKIRHPEAFDNNFFNIPPKQVNKLDPQLRILLEVGYEAILDAGLDPLKLRGSSTGVYIGACYSDAQAIFASFPEDLNGYETTGCALSMFANRMSYHYDLRGPSLTIDTACSSSLVAIDAACKAIQSGLCEHAIVGGTSILLRPSSSLAFDRLNMLSNDGKSKSFDESADGYVRSEGVGVIVLSRSDVANREYAKILGTGVNNDGYSEEGITFPNTFAQERLLREIYDSNHIDIQKVKYIEAHGTGTPAGDPQELGAIDRVFCQNRDESLLVGSVKSNIGHLEGGAGIASVIKAILAAQHGVLPGNLHYHMPNHNIPAITDGRISIVSENVCWEGGLIGVNSFGVGGTNAHVVLESKPVKDNATNEDIGTSFLPLFARSEAGIDRLIARLHKFESVPNKLVAHFVAIANADTTKFPYRGGIILDNNTCVSSVRTHLEEHKQRPVWFIFSGMGSQWECMAKDMMAIPVFREMMEYCATCVPDEAFDLLDLVTNSNSEVLNDALSAFVAITAVQISLLSVLNEYGIKPDGLIGHSVGEIAAAFADGAISIENAIKIAYARGASIKRCPQAAGAMAVIQSTWEEVQKYTEVGVYPACHNSARSVTLSGEETAIESIIKQLESENKFVKKVNSAGIAFHSRLIAPAAKEFRADLLNILSSPKSRSEKWKSSSSLNGEEPGYCDADYFVNNLVNPVQFHRAVGYIPDDALVIEIGPHSILKAPLRESVPSALYVNLMKKDDRCDYVCMKGLATAYASGQPIQTFDIARLGDCSNNYIFPMNVDWIHTTSWEVPNGEIEYLSRVTNSAETYLIDISEDEFSFIKDHQLNNKIIVPGMCYVYLAWKTYAKILNMHPEQINILEKDIKFLRPVFIGSDGTVELKVSVLKDTGNFQITHGDDLVAKGIIQQLEQDNSEQYRPNIGECSNFKLTKDDFYKEMALRGYQYGEQFRVIESISYESKIATLKWNGNWVTFLDGFLQCGVMVSDRKTIIPTFIRELRLFPSRINETGMVDVLSQYCTRRMWSRVAVIDGGKFASTGSTKPANNAKLMRYEFIPYYQHKTMDLEGQESKKSYFEAVQNYIVFNAKTILEYCENIYNDGLPEHLIKLSKALSSIPCSVPDMLLIDEISKQPNSILLRLAIHIFSDPVSFIDDPMPAIVKYSEHADLYSDDYIAGYFNQSQFLGAMMKVIYENIDGLSPVRICEVGSGTGGFATHILPTLRSKRDKYIFTDISAGFFEVLKNKFTSYSSVTDYAVWDIENESSDERLQSCDVIIANNVLHACQNIREVLKNIATSIKPNGFLLLFEQTHGYGTMLGIWGFIQSIWGFTDVRDNGPLLTHQTWLEILKEAGFDVVSYQDSGYSGTLYLCRKPVKITGSTLINFSDNDDSVDVVANALKNYQGNTEHRIWIQGTYKYGPGLIGMTNCARKEPNSSLIRALYFEDNEIPSDAEIQLIQNHDLAVNVFKQGKWGTYQFLPIDPTSKQQTDNAYVKIGTPGDLSTLYWSTAKPPLKSQLTITAKAICLNFKDLMLASGKLSPESFAGDINDNIGGEFAGVTSSGERMVGFIQSPLSTLVKADNTDLDQIYPFPENWSFEEAATVPIAYSTAYYALVIKADIQPGQTILIHSGTSSVGQAAIRIAHQIGCEIYTTVGSQSKREYILEKFPFILDNHISSSRTIEFESQFMELTSGAGINVVLNSLAGDFLKASLRLTSRYGVFLEIGKYDMIENSQIGMELLLKEISIYGVGINNLMLDNNAVTKKLKKLILEGIETGVVVPLPFKQFHCDSIEDAFRYLSSGKHIGKIVITLGDDNTANSEVNASPEFWCHPEKSYLITGGLGGFGIEIAEWLVSRGAKNLILTSRSGIRTDYQRYRVCRWERDGVVVTISNLDVSCDDQAHKLINLCQETMPLGGIFHLAMVMEDALLVNQNIEKFNHVSQVKLGGCKNLDKYSRLLCQELEHFVVFSSLSGAAGNPGQSSYGYANFGMDRICDKRHEENLPALSIQWGSIGDVGFVAEHKNLVNIKALGSDDQNLSSCLRALDVFLTGQNPVVASYVPYTDIHDLQAQDTNTESVSVISLIKDIKNILGVKGGEELDVNQTLYAIGMDSLMSVELQVKLETTYKIPVKLESLREMTVEQIVSLFDGDNDISSPQDEPKFITKVTQQERETFEIVYNNNNANKEVIFLTGTALDPKPLLASLDIPENLQLTIANYEVSPDVNEFSTKLHQYISNNEINEIKIVGFSTGALALMRALQLKGLDAEGKKITTVAISPPKHEVYSDLEYISPSVINSISEADALARFSASDWFGKIDTLPFDVIRNQFRFMSAMPFFNTDFGSVDEIILPDGDNICWSEDKAKMYTSKVSSINGKHDLRTLPIVDILGF